LGNTSPLVFYGNSWRDVACKNDVSSSGQTDSSLCTFQGSVHRQHLNFLETALIRGVLTIRPV
jgi:hypothetical protein